MSRGEEFAFAINTCESLVIVSNESTDAWWIGYLMNESSSVFYNLDPFPVIGNEKHNKNTKTASKKETQGAFLKNVLAKWTPLTLNNQLQKK